MSKAVKVFSVLPVTKRFRGKLYRLILGKRGHIGKNFQIGFGSYIESKHIDVGENVVIGNLVRVKLLDFFKLGDATSIGSSTIICGTYEEKKNQDRIFSAGNNCEILSSHYFDCVAPIQIGNKVTIGGKWTQFYTHSFDLKKNRLDGDIKIGNNIYIGAGCIINLGVSICDGVVLKSGTCISKSIEKEGVYSNSSEVTSGNVHNYSKLYGEQNRALLNDGSVVYTSNI